MAVLIDDPVIIGSVRKLAVQMKCSDEEAIGHAVEIELNLRKHAAAKGSDPVNRPVTSSRGMRPDRAEGQ